MEASDTTTQRNYYDDLARRAVGLPEKRVDASPGHQEALRLAKQFNAAALDILADPRVLPARGHTTLACFRKNS